MFDNITRKNQDRAYSPFRLAAIPGLIAGVIFARYTSPFLYVPLAATLLLGFVGKRFLPESRQRAVPALAVQAGYLTWLVVGFVGTRSPVLLPDIIILGTLFVWFFLALSRASAIAVAVGHALLLAINIWQVANSQFDSPEQRALTVHIVFRLLAVTLALHLFWPFRKPHAAPSPSPADPPGPGA